MKNQTDCRAETTAKGFIWANISTSTTSLLQGQSYMTETLFLNKPVRKVEIQIMYALIEFGCYLYPFHQRDVLTNGPELK